MPRNQARLQCASAAPQQCPRWRAPAIAARACSQLKSNCRGNSSGGAAARAILHTNRAPRRCHWKLPFLAVLLLAVACVAGEATSPAVPIPALAAADPGVPTSGHSANKAVPRRAKKTAAPANAAYTAGLTTVEKQGAGVYYRRGFVLGVGINVIEADLSNPEVRVSAMVSRGGIGTAERFGQMISRAQPAAAITGTFFGVQNHIPTGDLVINGHALFRGFIGTAVAITEGNVVSFISTRYREQAVDWSLFDTVIRAGPRLVDRGTITMTARSEGFRTLPVSVRRTRTAVGLTRDNHLQFVAVREGITLWELAKLMRAIGAYHAVALDGGTSTALYFAGRYVANPGRGLTNVLLIYHRKDRYEAMRHRFGGPYEPAPPPRLTGSSPPRGQGSPSTFQPAQSLDFPKRSTNDAPEKGPDTK